ncbi:MAG: hypothetical protein RID09_20700 [Coleofasciculus sp. G1-WW12-02]|uniref:hypothetical protein n=1 Tax=Coleofasciculus sp. G1-WW12-02 TaxID=3068483 RepID=UPI0033053CEC
MCSQSSGAIASSPDSQTEVPPVQMYYTHSQALFCSGLFTSVWSLLVFSIGATGWIGKRKKALRSDGK